MSKRKDPAAVSLGRRGGKAAAGKGAKQRWAAKTPEERAEYARQMALARWSKADKTGDK